MSIADSIKSIYDRIEKEPQQPVWISVVPREAALARAESLPEGLPLRGVPFAVKDNIDVAGMATTAGCPAYAYEPVESAPVVKVLEAAGAILIGKTNMDQFATGLVGTRSPYGACSSVYSDKHVSGGSSSGSAVAVAKQLVTFSLGTDTAGSGRVPAAFNNLIGLKPTRGLLSTRGVVPACRSLDCVSIFARTIAEARVAFQAARQFDAGDSFARQPRPGEGAAPWSGGPFRFGVPQASQLQFFGDDEAAQLYANALAALEQQGGEKVEIDYELFRAAADLLYAGPWVAERLAAISEFIDVHAAEMNPVVRGIIEGGARYTAVDAFRGQYRLNALRRAAEREWARMDVMVLPTTGTIFTHEQVAAEPIKRNSDLGYYTNFVNLMDLAAVAIPAGFRSNGLPFGISLIGPACSDDALLTLADRYLSPETKPRTVAPGCIEVAVVGAHLTGQPLNWQLTQRSARLVRSCRTEKGYRLYALSDTVPPKPGLVREQGFAGPGIEVEVWAVPEDRFGSFVAGVPAPLGIGNATLEDGTSVKAFICEPYALTGAREITSFGGWRAYLASLKA